MIEEKIIKKTTEIADFATLEMDRHKNIFEKEPRPRDFIIWYVENSIVNKPNINDFIFERGEVTAENLGDYKNWHNQMQTKILTGLQQKIEGYENLKRVEMDRIKEC